MFYFFYSTGHMTEEKRDIEDMNFSNVKDLLERQRPGYITERDVEGMETIWTATSLSLTQHEWELSRKEAEISRKRKELSDLEEEYARDKAWFSEVSEARKMLKVVGDLVSTKRKK